MWRVGCRHLGRGRLRDTTVLLPQGMRQFVLTALPGNRLLAALSSADSKLLLPHLDRMALPLRHTLEEADKPIEHIYFLEDGIASVVSLDAEDDEVEVGLIGREGMSGVVVLLGDHQTPHRTYMQVAGSGLRMPASRFRNALAESATMRAVLQKFVQYFMLQSADTATANGVAKINVRLARWLLMAHDRVSSDDIPLTHEFISLMLAVRRSGVTLAIQALSKARLITAHRGHVVICDRPGLEKLAGHYYGKPEAELRRLMARA